jgi:hypothetical protein
MPGLSPGHAADWHLPQLRLGESVRLFARVKTKHEVSICEEKGSRPTLKQAPEGTYSSAAASASRSEPEYAAQSPVDFVHERCRRVADRFLKVSLIEGDEGGYVDD